MRTRRTGRGGSRVVGLAVLGLSSPGGVVTPPPDPPPVGFSGCSCVVSVLLRKFAIMMSAAPPFTVLTPNGGNRVTGKHYFDFSISASGICGQLCGQIFDLTFSPKMQIPVGYFRPEGTACRPAACGCSRQPDGSPPLCPPLRGGCPE